MRRVSLFVCVLFVFFCQPFFSFAASDGAPLTGEEKAGLFVEVLSTVFDALENHNLSQLKDESKFSNFVNDEENEEARFESRIFFDATGLKISGTVRAEEVTFYLPEGWEHADRDVAKAIHKKMAFYHREERSQEEVRVFFRHSRLEEEDSYYVVRLDVPVGNATHLTLGCYKKDRRQATTVFSNSGAKWKAASAGSKRKGGDLWAAVLLQRKFRVSGDVFGRHQLEFSYVEGVPWLAYSPQLYPMWIEGNPKAAEKGFIKKLQGVYLDGKSLDAFQRTALRRPQLVQNSKQPSMPLNAEDIAALKGGTELRFDLVTVLDEKMQVVFPLKGSMKALSTVEARAAAKPVTNLIGLVLAGDREGLQSAINRGVTAHPRAGGERSPLSLAVSMEDTEMIRILGKAQGLDKEEKNSDGDGFLHIAAHYLHGTEVLKALLDIGCNPDIRDSTGRSPLSRTVCYQGFGKIDLLLAAGAHINATDEDGYTPLHHTVRNRFSSEDETAYLIKKGADKNKKNQDGNTPLMVAIDNQCWAHITKLLELKAFLSPENNKGQDALAMAESYRDSSDLTEKIPMLALVGEEAIQKIQESYKNLAEMLEEKMTYFLGFTNSTSETVYIATRIKGSDGDWATHSWAKLNPGAKELIGKSRNSIFYFFAESDSWVWKGTDNTRTISGKKYGMRQVTLDVKDRGEPYYYDLK
ncbi:ankyrin repeat domain-containing protein [Desulfoluna sp.]|uniref:ankyrin repeat domain-containing protein n=1 Tax=Desulfoluna sp. TaxID=2045199 RepID=UPI002615ADCA|nr:ankyrin repeat domain-containing protein [Desulfoluna sp.]